MSMPHAGEALQHSLVADVLAVEHVHTSGLRQLHAVVAENKGVIAHAAVGVIPLNAASETCGGFQGLWQRNAVFINM